MKLLAIETATEVCGVALVNDGELEGIEENTIPRKHASTLPLHYKNLREKLHFDLNDLDGIAVSIGPGSFTGLRIGLSYAKGLAYSHDLPIVPVPTLQAAAFGYEGENNFYTLIFSHRDMIFHQQLDSKGQQVSPASVSPWTKLKNEIEGKTCLHINCTKFLYDHEDKYEVKASAEKIGFSAYYNYDDWVNYSPFTLVPNYIAPFEINKAKTA